MDLVKMLQTKNRRAKRALARSKKNQPSPKKHGRRRGR